MVEVFASWSWIPLTNEVFISTTPRPQAGRNLHMITVSSAKVSRPLLLSRLDPLIQTPG